MPLVSISNAQRKPMPSANFVANVAPRPAGGPAAPGHASARRLSRLSRSHLAREAARPRHRDRARARRAAEDCGQGRPRRRGLLPRRRSSRCSTRLRRRVHRRDQRARRRASFSARRARLLFPIDWPEPFGLVDDRGDGLRHAGARLPLRLGAGSHRGRRHRHSSSTASTRRLPRCPRVIGARPARRPAALRATLHGDADGRRTMSTSIARCCRPWSQIEVDPADVACSLAADGAIRTVRGYSLPKQQAHRTTAADRGPGRAGSGGSVLHSGDRAFRRGRAGRSSTATASPCSTATATSAPRPAGPTGIYYCDTRYLSQLELLAQRACSRCCSAPMCATTIRC